VELKLRNSIKNDFNPQMFELHKEKVVGFDQVELHQDQVVGGFT
jgi:hypothetical protein